MCFLVLTFQGQYATLIPGTQIIDVDQATVEMYSTWKTESGVYFLRLMHPGCPSIQVKCDMAERIEKKLGVAIQKARLEKAIKCNNLLNDNQLIMQPYYFQKCIQWTSKPVVSTMNENLSNHYY